LYSMRTVYRTGCRTGQYTNCTVCIQSIEQVAERDSALIVQYAYSL